MSRAYTCDFINLPDGIVSHELVAGALSWNEVTANGIKLTFLDFDEAFGFFEMTINNSSS